MSLTLPAPIAAVVALEAGRRGVSVATFIIDRLSDAYGLRPPAPAASKVPLMPEDKSANER